MSFYNVSNKPPETMTEAEIRQEYDELRRELVAIEGRLAEKKAWTLRDGQPPPDYHEWVAKSRRFHTLLLTRLVTLRPFLRKLNLAAHAPKPRKTKTPST